MKSLLLMLFVTACPLAMFGQSSVKKPALPPHPNTPAS
jgi:hypothetical protein